MKASPAAAQYQQLRRANNLPPVHNPGSDNDHQTLLNKALTMVLADERWRKHRCQLPLDHLDFAESVTL
jgi:hypothetical protein